MGLDAECTVQLGERFSAGRALLETDELLFRGDFRLTIPFADVVAVEAARGALTVQFSDRVAVFNLGKRAEQWARKIRYPSPLLDKLGVKQGSHVTVLHIEDAVFHEQLPCQTQDVATSYDEPDREIILLGANSTSSLADIGRLIPCLRRNGSIWVVYPKGKQSIREDDVLAAGRLAGLVDLKIASFSATHSALKFVIPVAQR